MAKRTILTGGLAMLMATSCGTVPPPDAAWQEPAAYAFTMQASCGFRVLNGRFRVDVRDGEVVEYARLDAAGGNPNPLENADMPTLGDMFDRVAEAREKLGTDVSLETDPADGHPTSVSIDWIVTAIDDEECYEVTEYAAGEP